MKQYVQEASGPTLSGVVTVGNVAGYNGGREVTLGEVVDLIAGLNTRFADSMWPCIPCMIREEHLIGGPVGGLSRENLYRMTFSWSPRDDPISTTTFFEGLCEYGFRLGETTGQERVYVDFGGNTLVFKLTNKEVGGEDSLKLKALSYLDRGRPNWDAPHTTETVDWMEKLVDAEGGNRRVLVSTMWLHDIGYSGLFKGKRANFDNVSGDLRAVHMECGADIARKILGDLKYPQNEIDRIAHLVSIHDTLAMLESPYEIMVMEADTLGMLSQNLIQDPAKSDFSESDQARFITHVRDDRSYLFRTETGKRHLNDLLLQVEGGLDR